MRIPIFLLFYFYTIQVAYSSNFELCHLGSIIDKGDKVIQINKCAETASFYGELFGRHIGKKSSISEDNKIRVCLKKGSSPVKNLFLLNQLEASLVEEVNNEPVYDFDKLESLEMVGIQSILESTGKYSEKQLSDKKFLELKTKEEIEKAVTPYHYHYYKLQGSSFDSAIPQIGFSNIAKSKVPQTTRWDSKQSLKMNKNQTKKLLSKIDLKKMLRITNECSKSKFGNLLYIKCKIQRDPKTEYGERELHFHFLADSQYNVFVQSQFNYETVPELTPHYTFQFKGLDYYVFDGLSEKYASALIGFTYKGKFHFVKLEKPCIYLDLPLIVQNKEEHPRNEA